MIAWSIGCGSVQSEVDASAGGDGSVAIDAQPGTDASPGGDAAIVHGSVACGIEGGMCPTPDEYCCVDTSGAAECMAGAGGECAAAYGCDGPEDCGAGSACCFTGGSQCAPTSACEASGGERMCHSELDCKTGENCCGLHPGPISDSYGVCSPDACPQ